MSSSSPPRCSGGSSSGSSGGRRSHPMRKTHVRGEYAGLTEEERFDLCRDRLKGLARERHERNTKKQRSQAMSEARGSQSRNIGGGGALSPQAEGASFGIQRHGAPSSSAGGWGDRSVGPSEDHDADDTMPQPESWAGYGEHFLMNENEQAMDGYVHQCGVGFLPAEDCPAPPAEDEGVPQGLGHYFSPQDLNSMGLLSGATSKTLWLLRSLEEELQLELENQHYDQFVTQFGAQRSPTTQKQTAGGASTVGFGSGSGFSSGFTSGFQSNVAPSGFVNQQQHVTHQQQGEDEDAVPGQHSEGSERGQRTPTQAELEYWEELGIVM